MRNRTVAILIGSFMIPVIAGAEPPPRFVSALDKAEMVLVPSGEFTYGVKQSRIKELLKRIKSRWVDFYASELPPKAMSLEAFYIDRYEVTNERYGMFLKATGYQHPSRFASYPQLNGAKQPVVGIGWQDAEAYCAWAGKRLPSEEEWEKAARGTDARRFVSEPPCRRARDLGPDPTEPARRSSREQARPDHGHRVGDPCARRSRGGTAPGPSRPRTNAREIRPAHADA